MAQLVYHSKTAGNKLFHVSCCYGKDEMKSITIVVEDYTPSIEDTDVDDLVNFCVELFSVKNVSEVQNG